MAQFDTAVGSIKDLLTHFTKSNYLEEFLATRFEALIYANLISNFFNNMNTKVVNELKLPSGQILNIKKNFTTTRKEIENALKFHPSLVNEEYYKNFKKEIDTKYPEFDKLILEIESKFNVSQLKNYLKSLKVSGIKPLANTILNRIY